MVVLLAIAYATVTNPRCIRSEEFRSAGKELYLHLRVKRFGLGDSCILNNIKKPWNKIPSLERESLVLSA